MVELEKFIVNKTSNDIKRTLKEKDTLKAAAMKNDHELFRPRSNKNRQKKKTQKYYENYYSDTVDGQIEEK